ncbi:MarR family winged helix-turn-helix transcriptional regulator [Fructilactobacillus fructivorans]|uniref:Transcriptional regulator n=1 Tax=Fructilactobacillus fructivorans TaxID=1614 RepID=A0A0C1PP69_9LACO|nr:MarR family transcriptional regulator [Fructilactobacillus fructivorans]KID42567.1 Transcriptional regulator [Fructilactobacillus fructivorans]KRK58643.1 regulatory protein MarR [Fructilactobacillus fructivorans]KRN13551.1 regulatory protein MarR [Fructilactobacillus fructivorans]MCT0151793.1 MarR family transcriptional regulator [Fructilactobacillus fructivorans]MCT2868078.1 MarR family transcriptional regulator [Fructilactobacillus fructivorans]
MKNSLTALRVVGKIHQQQLQALTKKSNLTISEWQLLIAITDGYTTQESLSQSMELDTSTLSRQLKRLVEKEMIRKKAVGQDKRQLIYSITDKGKNACNQINSDYADLSTRIFNQWTDEEKNLLKILLNRLETSMKKIRK